MKIRKSTFVSMVGLLVVLSFAVYIFRSKDVVAEASSITINEIMYHPVSGNEDDEFLELHNTTLSTIDLENWCFTDGIVICFSAGTSIAAGGYAVISPNPTQTLSTYGINTIGTYTGRLANSGETLTLVDGAAQVISSLSYDDSSPWSSRPDGSGPSLELKDPELDTSLPSSWFSSLDDGGTPEAQNSVFGLVIPTVSIVTKPSNVGASDTPTLIIQVDDASIVNLYYRVGFGDEQQLPMHDDGSHGDSAPADGIYGVSLPSQASGQLVRYRVEAIGNQSLDANYPSLDDSIDYDGYVVQDGVTSNAPIIRWFVSDEAYADIIDNPIEDESYRKSVIEYDGTVYDNTDFRLKGEYSRTFPKKGFKFKLPSGHSINLEGGSNRSIDEFHINSNWMDGTGGAATTAWWAARESGMVTPDISAVRIQKNNQFEGVYTFAEKYEKEWRQEFGFDTGNIYEDFWEKEQGEPELDRSDIEDWKVQMNAFKDQSKRDYVLDNNDIPNILNFTAFNAITRSSDYSIITNTFAYHDTERTGRWSLWLWDLDLVLSGDPSQSYITPYDSDAYILAEDRFPATAIYQQDDMKGMYYRRLRTLVDKFYSNDSLRNKFISEVDSYAPDIELDNAKWPLSDTYQDLNFGTIERFRTMEANYLSTIDKQKINLLFRYRLPWAIPEAQKQEDIEQVYIDEVGVDSGNDGNEYIKISNNSDEYVDVSDWIIEGVDYTIPSGSVVPPSGSIYFVKNDTAYRNLHAPVFIAGQYQNSLSISGPNELVLKSNSNQEINSYIIN